MIPPDPCERDVAAHGDPAADLDAQRADDVHLPRDHLPRQPVSRHTDRQHARRHRLGLEDHRPEAEQGQIVRRRESGGPATKRRGLKRVPPRSATRTGYSQRRARPEANGSEIGNPGLNPLKDQRVVEWRETGQVHARAGQFWLGAADIRILMRRGTWAKPDAEFACTIGALARP